MLYDPNPLTKEIGLELTDYIKMAVNLIKSECFKLTLSITVQLLNRLNDKKKRNDTK